MFCLVQLQPAWARLDTGGQVSGGQKGLSTADSDPRLQIAIPTNNTNGFMRFIGSEKTVTANAYC